MSAFYDRLAATASRLLANFGQDVVVTIETPGTFDPITGTESGSSTTEYTLKGALFPYTFKEAGDIRSIGGEVRESDRKLLLESFAVEPEVTMSVNVDGYDWTVMNIKPIRPAGTSVIHEIQVRR